MTMEILAKQFNKEYDFLYDHDDRVAGYEEAVDAFDQMTKTNGKEKQILIDFVNYRMDFITSDREAAAFMFALEALS